MGLRGHSAGVLSFAVAASLLVGACTSGVAEPGRPLIAQGVAAGPSTPPDAPAVDPPSTTLPHRDAPDPPPRGRLVIHAVGDVNLDPDYIPTFRTTGYAHAWAGLDGLFLRDSLTVVNLECAVSHLGQPLDKAFTFRCDPDALADAAAAGVDVANLANNHAQDFGVDAMLDSVTNLTNVAISPVGVGEDAAAAGAPAMFDIAGWRVAVVGFGGVIPAPSWVATDTHPGMRDGDDTATMVAAVEDAAAIADIVLVTIHWGVERDTAPRADDIARAQAMIAAGADAIFGHHSHRLNPLEFVDGAPVAWGLGNFVWPRFSLAGATTAVARVVVEPDGRVGACLLSAEIVSHGHPRLTDSAACTMEWPSDRPDATTPPEGSLP